MNDNLYRKKTIDKVKSPENLDDYIQVSNPGVWILLISVIVLLVGACVWGVFGHIDSVVDVNVRSENGKLVCYVPDDALFFVQTGMTVKINQSEAIVTEIVQSESTEYVCNLRCDQSVADGIYKGKLIIQSFKPISFILN